MTDYNFAGFNLARDIVHQTAVEKGWWEPQEQIVALPLQGGPIKAMVPRSMGDVLALVHSEVSEALEENRNGHAPTETYFPNAGMHGPQASSPLQELAWARSYGWKPEGVPSELADIIIRVLDIAGYYGIDIEHAMLVKTGYNEGRSYRHGGKTL